MTVHLPMRPDEVVARLAAITQAHLPTPRERRTHSHRSFCGVVNPTEFRLSPTWWSGGFLNVEGSIRPDGDDSVLTARIALPVPVLLVPIILLVAGVVLMIAFPVSTSAFFLAKAAWLLITTAVGAVVAVRVGIARTSRAMLAALDPFAPAIKLSFRSSKRARRMPMRS